MMKFSQKYKKVRVAHGSHKDSERGDHERNVLALQLISFSLKAETWNNCHLHLVGPY